MLSRAVQVASLGGLESLTIGRLATDVKISKANISVLFGDKTALQIATFEAAIDIFAQRVVHPALEEPTPVARLLALTEGWYSFVANRVLPGGCMVHGASSEYRARPGPVQDRVRLGWVSWLGLLSRSVAEAQLVGELSATIDPAQLAFELAAYQSAANVASLLGDFETFDRARITSAAAISRLSMRRTNQREALAPADFNRFPESRPAS